MKKIIGRCKLNPARKDEYLLHFEEYLFQLRLQRGFVIRVEIAGYGDDNANVYRVLNWPHADWKRLFRGVMCQIKLLEDEAQIEWACGERISRRIKHLEKAVKFLWEPYKKVYRAKITILKKLISKGR